MDRHTINANKWTMPHFGGFRVQNALQNAVAGWLVNKEASFLEACNGVFSSATGAELKGCLRTNLFPNI